MSQHIDPASAEFTRLPRYQQAAIYHSLGWDVQAIAEELDLHPRNARRWTTPGGYEAHLAYKREHWAKNIGPEKAREKERDLYRRKRAGLPKRKAGRKRSFDYAKAAELKAEGLQIKVIARRLGVSETSVFVALRAMRKAA